MSTSNPGPAITTGSTDIGLGSPQTVGTTTSSLIAFYGSAPIAQRAASTQATSLVSGVSTGAVSTNSLVLASLLEVMSTLQALGLWKGAA
jgi:hypothetical protein